VLHRSIVFTPARSRIAVFGDFLRDRRQRNFFNATGVTARFLSFRYRTAIFIFVRITGG
jgi:hypothetical protein